MHTELEVDGYRQLREIRYPDGGIYSFEYADNDGLLTAKIEPETNRFSHRFDIIGRLTDVKNNFSAPSIGYLIPFTGVNRGEKICKYF